MTTAYGGTDVPLDTAVATSGRSPYTAATASGETDERHHLQADPSFGSRTPAKVL